MNPEKEAIVSFRVKKEYKDALKQYCNEKGVSESNYCLDKLIPYFDVLIAVYNVKQSENVKER